MLLRHRQRFLVGREPRGQLRRVVLYRGLLWRRSQPLRLPQCHIHQAEFGGRGQQYMAPAALQQFQRYISLSSLNGGDGRIPRALQLPPEPQLVLLGRDDALRFLRHRHRLRHRAADQGDEPADAQHQRHREGVRADDHRRVRERRVEDVTVVA